MKKCLLLLLTLIYFNNNIYAQQKSREIVYIAPIYSSYDLTNGVGGEIGLYHFFNDDFSLNSNIKYSKGIGKSYGSQSIYEKTLQANINIFYSLLNNSNIFDIKFGVGTGFVHGNVKSFVAYYNNEYFFDKFQYNTVSLNLPIGFYFKPNKLFFGIKAEYQMFFVTRQERYNTNITLIFGYEL